PSVLPLSAIRISPDTPAPSMPVRAFLMHAASVSASLRQGIRIVSSGAFAMGSLYRPLRGLLIVFLPPFKTPAAGRATRRVRIFPAVRAASLAGRNGSGYAG